MSADLHFQVESSQPWKHNRSLLPVVIAKLYHRGMLIEHIGLSLPS